ncbi:hypothetical protein OIU84_028066 [Salix udensis]|uniref:galactinol--sucrose galactosyltransferase n=1 Tax=Salix udensis TaxID=889485 RepID=A0AAD6P8Z6_9ROSI|nr:hypothetical protein OIU84_028066 [Salix udensis]
MAPSLSKSSSGSSGLDGNNPYQISLAGSNFVVNGHVFLSDVPDNITLSPSPPVTLTEKTICDTAGGSFVGFDSKESKDRHVVPIGKLKNIKFMSIFRFKDDPTFSFFLFSRGPFRASLQPGAAAADNVDVCVESGSTKVCGDEFRSVVYVHAGDDPFNLMKEAMKVVRVHLGTFKLLEEKTPPGIVDKFGWCTWDAFYLTVHPQGIWDGVKGLVDGGCPPGLVLIDDGWQSISRDEDPVTKEGMTAAVDAGEQMPCRLLKFQENYKVQGLQFSTVDYVYVWHALCGYWGGVRPDVSGLPPSQLVKPKLSPGLAMTMEDLAVDKIVSSGVGLVPPEMVDQMYEGIHSHLEKVGIDGVKVDVIHLLEMLCEDYGGRVDLAKAYYKALTASVRKHFKGNGVIASMEHCNDFMFLGTEAISLGRVGDDFWCTDPSGDPNGTFWLQGCHMVHCAYNSLWMGNFIHPDWDMFQSTHPCAEFHAASRAISGGPIYVSDSVGKHNFPLLKKLVLPDGSILRCICYALPTRDCLFKDPLHDGNTMLKIWNLNKFTGVIGAFNCQGGGWCRETRRNKCASRFSNPVTTKTSPKDIEWSSGKNPISIDGVQAFAMYLSQSKKLVLSEPHESIEIALEPFNFELVTVSPVTTFAGKPVRFAPIGFGEHAQTPGGAIQSVTYTHDPDSSVQICIKGGGEMRVFSSEKPRACKIDGRDVALRV